MLTNNSFFHPFQLKIDQNWLLFKSVFLLFSKMVYKLVFKGILAPFQSRYVNKGHLTTFVIKMTPILCEIMFVLCRSDLRPILNGVYSRFPLVLILFSVFLLSIRFRSTSKENWKIGKSSRIYVLSVLSLYFLKNCNYSLIVNWYWGKNVKNATISRNFVLCNSWFCAFLFPQKRY